MITIKNEPIECEENYDFNQIDLNFAKVIKTKSKLIDEFSIDNILTNSCDDIDFNIDDKVNFLDFLDQSSFNDLNYNNQHKNELSVENIFNKLVNNSPIIENRSNNFYPAAKIEPKQKNNESLRIKNHKRQLQQQQQHQQQSFDKSYELKEPFSPNESSSSSTSSTTQVLPKNFISQTEVFEAIKCDYDVMSVNDEELVLNQLNKLFDDEKAIKKLPTNLKHSIARYKCKLNLRKLKRSKRLKLFDIDAYTNELIDSEKSRKQQEIEDNQEQKQHLQISASNSNNNNDVEIIAVYRVLDRFNKSRKVNHFSYSLNLSYKIGLIEFRNDDIKCVVSPYTKNLLKPYIRRDFESWPLKLKLHKEIHQKCIQSKLNNYLSLTTFERSSIDYVYLRPEHVFVINYLCKTYFWTGIDVTECLQYPDYTCVALYRKIIIGFAFIVPNASYKEDYLSFIFVHPNWRQSGIAKYMLYRLANINLKNDLILHVSVSNTPAILLYQKFGFKIKEYIKHFYDKYYFDDKYDSMNKDAFLMRLTR